MVLSVCSHPGCPTLTDVGTCPEHRRERAPDHRASATARGYGWQWSQYAKQYKETHPRCRACEAVNRISATDLVDHITPVTGPDDPLFWEAANHQPLCRPCHAVKTRAEGRTQQEPAEPTERFWFA